MAREGALTPWLASVLAIPTPGFLRRVHSDARIASRRQRGLRRCHGVAWRLTVRMVWPCGGLFTLTRSASSGVFSRRLTVGALAAYPAGARP